MSDWALYLGIAAVLCAVCSLLGAGLADVWGVDPSREAPGTHRRGAGWRLVAGQIQCFAAILPACLWLGAEMGQVLGRMSGALMCAGYALLCTMLGLLALFTSVRHGGQGMAHVCGEELFVGAGRMRHALGCFACIFGAGAILMSLLRDDQVDVTNFQLYLFSCAVWPMISMQTAANHLAPQIQNERQILPAVSGSMVCAALITMMMLLPGASMLMSWELYLVLTAGIVLVWLLSWITLLCLSGKALHGLLERPFTRKKRNALPETLLCAAVSIALALCAGAWLFLAAAALCALAVLMDFVACSAWIRRIGRGFFS